MSKKLVKGDTKPVAKLNGEDLAAQKEKQQKLFVGVAAVLAIIMIVYIVWENHHTKYLVSINGEKATIEDMMYDVYEIEDVYGYMANFYAQLGYGDYWTMEAGENGETVQELAKEECMDSYVKGNILYQEAVANGYEVTEEDKKDAKEVLDSIFEAYTTTDEESGEKVEPTEVLGYTAEELGAILEEREVAMRYKDALVAAYGVTEADVVDSIDKEAFRQYDIEYFTISLDGEAEEDGGVEEVTGAEKEVRYEKIKAVLEQAGDKDWSKVLGDEKSDEVAVKYDKDGFIADESYFDDETTAKITSMKNGEVSDIIESEGSYYVIKMVNNNSTERYESEIADAVAEAEEVRFEEEYETIKAKYDVEIYNGDWKKVQLGNLSY